MQVKEEGTRANGVFTVTQQNRALGSQAAFRQALPRRRFMAMVGAGGAGTTLALAAAGLAMADSTGTGGATVTGSLGVNSAGTFANYVINNPGSTAITLLMNYGPFDAESAHRVGFIVYQAGSKLFSGTGTATGLHDTVNSTTISASITPSASGGPVLVMVFNYGALPISYSLAPSSGVTLVAMPTAGTTGAASSTSTAASASALTTSASTTAGTTGTMASSAGGNLPGTSGGGFANYLITNPNGGPVGLIMTYSPFDPGASHRIGFNVYQNGVKLFGGTGTATGLHDNANSTTITASIIPSATGGTVFIQVFNYSAATISFSLRATGAALAAQSAKS